MVQMIKCFEIFMRITVNFATEISTPAPPTPTPPTPSPPERALSALDGNGDHRVDTVEWARFYHLLDTDSDGQLTLAEIGDAAGAVALLCDT